MVCSTIITTTIHIVKIIMRVIYTKTTVCTVKFPDLFLINFIKLATHTHMRSTFVGYDDFNDCRGGF